jgi:hypothetical protein
MTRLALAAALVAAVSFASLATAETRVEKRAERVAAKAAQPREIGGALPGPLALKIEKQNKPEDKLLFEATYATPVGSGYVVELKIVWGDLDNKIKGVGKQYYSKWDGSLDLVTGVGEVDKKIQFDDKGGERFLAHHPGASTQSAATEPHEGSGRDLLVDKAGAHIEWKAGVVGALDGLRIKITSATPTVKGTLKAGNFEIPLNITAGAAPAPAVQRQRATR